MTFEQVRTATMKLLNQFSVAGDEIDGSYNNQADYLKRIPELVNDAMMEIATTARKIPAVLELKRLYQEDLGHEVRYTLPDDFYQFVSGSVVKTSDGRMLHTNVYSTQGKKHLILPKDEAKDYTITYYRYPKLLGDRPEKSAELDNEPETHRAIPYYVAAYLVMQDDAFQYASFYNKYEDKLAKMGQGIHAEVRIVDDAYAFFG